MRIDNLYDFFFFYVRQIISYTLWPLKSVKYSIFKLAVLNYNILFRFVCIVFLNLKTFTSEYSEHDDNNIPMCHNHNVLRNLVATFMGTAYIVCNLPYLYISDRALLIIIKQLNDIKLSMLEVWCKLLFCAIIAAAIVHHRYY